MIGSLASLTRHLDLNTLLTLFTIVVLIVGTPRVMRAAVYKTRDEEKEKIVAMKEETIVALRQRLQVTEEDRDRAVADVQRVTRKQQELEKGVEGLKTRFAEQSKYTAEESVKVFRQLLERHDRDAERRHIELMAALDQISKNQGRFIRGD